MAVYVRLPPFPTGFVTWPVCFTGPDVLLFGALLLALETVLGGFFFGVIGVIVSLIFGPEVVPQLIGGGVGIVVGLVVGAIYGAVLVTKGSCTCPAGRSGFCVCFLLLVLPSASNPILLPPFFIPCPGQCAPPPAGLMPAGCP